MRLIDADELMEHVYRAKLDSRELIADMVNNAPTIEQLEDYAKLKREFLRMASYIDALLECSDDQKETLMGFISRLAEFMPWTKRD